MKKLFSLLLAVALLAGVTACGSSSNEDDKKIIVGASSSPHAEILEACKDQLKKAGYELEIKEFDDYVVPNDSLESGELDANYFQHLPYLKQFNEDKGTHLTSVAAIHFEPLGIYSNEATSKNDEFGVNDVKEGAKIAVPDDATNEARALQLLAAHGVITLKEGVGLKATKTDITENPKNVEIVEIEAANIPASLSDLDFAVINGNYALSGKVTENVITTESKDSEGAKEFANVLAVKKGNEKTKKTKALIKALTSKETKAFIEEKFGDLVIPVFE